MPKKPKRKSLTATSNVYFTDTKESVELNSLSPSEQDRIIETLDRKWRKKAYRLKGIEIEFV